MKLIIQIPCYNEERTLPLTLKDLPRTINGIEKIEYLVIDDGSTDRTISVAKQSGVHHILKLPEHQGLARGFAAGLEHAVRLGADIIVNTDADNQYNGSDIEQLIQPILAGKAGIVIGDRQIDDIPHFSPLKKKLQKLGSWIVRIASNTRVPDAASGFRAFSREAALRLNVYSSYSYTLETIIQAGRSHIAIVSVPIHTNPPLRESRLLKSTAQYLTKSGFTILRLFMVYKPFRFFGILGIASLSAGILLGLRFLYLHYLLEQGEGHIQSLILAAILLIGGIQLILFAFIADLIAVNRRILEDVQFRQRKDDLLTTTSPKKEKRARRALREITG